MFDPRIFPSFPRVPRKFVPLMPPIRTSVDEFDNKYRGDWATDAFGREPNITDKLGAFAERNKKKERKECGPLLPLPLDTRTPCFSTTSTRLSKSDAATCATGRPIVGNLATPTLKSPSSPPESDPTSAGWSQKPNWSAWRGWEKEDCELAFRSGDWFGWKCGMGVNKVGVSQVASSLTFRTWREIDALLFQSAPCA